MVQDTPTERQFYLITQLFKDWLQVPQEETKNIGPLISEVRYLLNQYTKEQVIQHLKEFQIEENIVVVLVENVSKTAPTPQIDARVLMELDDHRFKEFCPVTI